MNGGEISSKSHVIWYPNILITPKTLDDALNIKMRDSKDYLEKLLNYNKILKEKKSECIKYSKANYICPLYNKSKIPLLEYSCLS